MQIPSLKDILQAHHLIKSQINKTPILTNSYLNNLTGANIYFKCENFQKVGAFKYRGATNAVLNLINHGYNGAVATHSSGNHAQALALAARVNGLNAIIVMPSNSPNVKVNAVKGYGAEVIFCEPNIKARETTLNQILVDREAIFVHPYENPNVIAGQGTAALELINEVNDLDIIMTPIGGGGLISGTAITAKEISAKSKEIKVIGAEPQMANDAFISFISKERVKDFTPNTICDGLRTTIGEINFEIMNKYLDDILLADENEIISAMKLTWERMKIIIEPSCSVPLATILKNYDTFAGKKVGVILSGGNIDLQNLPW
ncbi:MAG: threonine/serine dehydratase [Candidatus Kapaibacteriota bacterium]|jgi:threonine dehydratase